MVRACLFGLWLVTAGAARADEVLVFAASSTVDAIAEAGEVFFKQTGHRVRVSPGASNTLARQIRAGARADLFLSADLTQMESLEAAGRVRRDQRVELLSNQLVVIVPHRSSTESLQPAQLERFGRVGLADPELVPAGIYARQWLQSAGLWERLKARVVPLLNARATLAAVESGNLPAGIVYRTDAARSPRVRVVFEVPREEGPRIVYPLAPIVGSRSTQAPEFLRFLQGAEGRAVFARHGFIVLSSAH